METRKEVALFIDFEHIRYGTLQAYGVEPSASLLIETARKYGLVNIARAYADFENFPPEVLRDLQVSGITAVNVQAHTVGDRRKSGADMDMLVDVVETLLDRAAISTLILMTGDRDFLRVVTMARNRFAKEVIISGVPGSVSQDLISAASGDFDPLEIPGFERIDRDGPGVERLAPSSRIERIERGEQVERDRDHVTYGRAEGPAPRVRTGPRDRDDRGGDRGPRSRLRPRPRPRSRSRRRTSARAARARGGGTSGGDRPAVGAGQARPARRRARAGAGRARRLARLERPSPGGR